MWNNILTVFQRYMGTGSLIIWFLFSVIYLFFRERRKQVRILFLYVPVVILVLFFNPLFIHFFYRLVGDEIYFRICWLLPISVVIAYATVMASLELMGKKRPIFAILAVGLIVTSGTLVYENPLFSKAENVYHVPQTVVDICDRIVLPGREVMAVFPSEFLVYVRQYSPVVCMPFGRGTLLGDYDELEVLMNQDTIDVSRMAELAKQKQCHYVIFSEQKQMDEDITQYDYVEFDHVNGYVIYKDSTMNFSLHWEK